MAGEVEMAKIASWLNTHWHGGTTCPICGHNDWGVNPKLFEMREFQGGGLVVGFTLIQPLVIISCRVCGHVLLFNAAVMGVWSPTTKPATKAEPPVPATPSPEDMP
jgi:hypothetical protein